MKTKTNRIVIVAMMALTSLSALAQEKGITPQLLDQMRKEAVQTPQDKALQNALATQGIQALAVAAVNDIPGGTYFSHKVKSSGITDQKGSGRCWLFTGLNVMRARMMQTHHLGTVTLSQNYVSFYDQLEKANLFLQSIIDNVKKPMDDRVVDWLFKNPIGDGGTFTGVSDLVTKYGVVPSEAMAETSTSNSTSTYRALMGQKLREFGLRLREMGAKGAKAQALQAKKEEQLKEVYRLLVRLMGEPPTKFTWTRTDKDGNPLDTREYTPQQFYQEYIGSDLKGNYVMFMNDPSRDYYKTYEIDLDRHVYDGTNWVFVNVPMDDIRQMAIASIKDSTMLYMSCDVNKQYNRDRGYSDPMNYQYGPLLGTTFPMDKKERIMTFASSSTHAMTLMAVDLDEQQKPRKWMVENSGGATSGYKGHIIMSDAWLGEYLFRLVVEKKYVPQRLLDLAKQKPIMLPAWDPLFAVEE